MSFPPSSKRAPDDDDQPQPAAATIIRVALSPFGPPDHMEAALDVLFACIARFHEPAATDDGGGGPPLELVVMDEAKGRYAEALQTRATALAAAAHEKTAAATRRRSFKLRIGDITQPGGSDDDGGQAHTHTHILACPCDRRLLPSPDHPASHDVFRAAGPQLASTAKLFFHRAEPQRAYAVKLPATSELRAQRGVQYVVLACPPGGEEEGWQAALRGTYEAVLACVAGEVAPKIVATAPAAPAPSPARKKAKPSHDATAASPPPLPPSVPSPAIPAYRHPGPPPQSMGWQGGLHQYLQRAATDAALRAFVFLETERYMVVRFVVFVMCGVDVDGRQSLTHLFNTCTTSQQQVYDGYPKAGIHLLLMPKPAYLAANAVTDLRREHLDRYACFFFPN